MKRKTSSTEQTKTQRQQELEKAIANFERKEVPQVQKKKNKWLGPLFTIIAIAIGVVLILIMSADLDEDQKGFVEVFSSVKPINAVYFVLAVLGIMIFDMVKYSVIIHATTNKFYPLIGVKTSLLGKYYDNITPFSSGGQPMQIYYLYKKGFGGGLSSAVIMIKYAFNTTAWLLVAFVSMICNTHILDNIPNGNVLLIAGWIGWGINSLLPVFIFSFALMPKFAKKLTHWVVHLGSKMKIVKNEEEVMAKAEGVVSDFRSAFVIMSRRPVHMVCLAITCIAELVLSYALPYFVIKLVNGFDVDNGIVTMFSMMGLNAYAIFSASVVPTPGNSGALEGLLTLAFSTIATTTLTWAMFTLRFATFYIYIIIGVGITIFNFIRNIVRTRRMAKMQQQGTTPQDDELQTNSTTDPIIEVIENTTPKDENN